MEEYLSTLVGQVVSSYNPEQSVRYVVEAKGTTLDLARATPAGLILNEIVTNSLKYAFPESFDSQAFRNAPPTISITVSKNGGMYTMTAADNGIGLPPEFDISKTQTMGLELVNFLAKYQLRAEIDVNTGKDTEFIFRFKEKE